MKRIAVLLLMTFVACWFISVSTGLAVPLPPDMSLEKTGINLKITWTSSVGADGYRLYYAAYPYTGPTSIGSIDIKESTEINFTLWEEASYYVAVTAYDETGESRYSNSELFLLGPYTTDHTEGTPELTIDTDALEVATSWTEVTGATSYRLYYAPYPFTDSDTIVDTDMGDSTEADFTLWDGAAFYVAMTAEENGNESAFSNVELLLTGNPVPEWQNTGYTDTDNDGYSLDEGDCDDGDATISPLGVEVCGDDIDQDCSGSDEICPVDPLDVDDDNDGYTENTGDCNDTEATINPGASETCGDGIDQDCSGADLLCPSAQMSISSTSYVNNGAIPLAQACGYEGGSNLSPQLSWSNLPTNTAELVLIMDDETDSPGDNAYVHWNVFDLNKNISPLSEGQNLLSTATEGITYAGTLGYQGPCPPSAHIYKLTLYALDINIDGSTLISSAVTRSKFARDYAANILDSATWTGMFTP